MPVEADPPTSLPRRRCSARWVALGLGIAMAAAACSSASSASPPESSEETTVIETTTLPPPPPTTEAPTTSTTAPPAESSGGGKGESKYGVQVIHWIDTDDPVVFITIDDGTVKDPAVLDYLKSNNIPVTSFLLSPQVEDNPAFWQKIHDLPSSINSHTINHKNLRNLSLDGQTAQICPPVDEYQQMFGVRPTLFRPPYGNYNDDTMKAASSCGIKALVLWAGVMEKGKLTMQHPLQSGDIILFHYVPELITDLKTFMATANEKGLKPAHLEDYIAGATPLTSGSGTPSQQE